MIYPQECFRKNSHKNEKGKCEADSLCYPPVPNVYSGSLSLI
jgi:hypothetical protein